MPDTFASLRVFTPPKGLGFHHYLGRDKRVPATLLADLEDVKYVVPCLSSLNADRSGDLAGHGNVGLSQRLLTTSSSMWPDVLSDAAVVCTTGDNDVYVLPSGSAV